MAGMSPGIKKAPLIGFLVIMDIVAAGFLFYYFFGRSSSHSAVEEAQNFSAELPASGNFASTSLEIASSTYAHATVTAPLPKQSAPKIIPQKTPPQTAPGNNPPATVLVPSKPSSPWGCMTEGCFNAYFVNCQNAYFVKMMGGVTSMYFESRGAVAGGCKVFVQYVKTTRPDLVGPGMTCVLDNRKTLGAAWNDVYIKVLAGQSSSCEGSLVKLLRSN